MAPRSLAQLAQLQSEQGHEEVTVIRTISNRQLSLSSVPGMHLLPFLEGPGVG